MKTNYLASEIWVKTHTSPFIDFYFYFFKITMSRSSMHVNECVFVCAALMSLYFADRTDESKTLLRGCCFFFVFSAAGNCAERRSKTNYSHCCIRWHHLVFLSQSESVSNGWPYWDDTSHTPWAAWGLFIGRRHLVALVTAAWSLTLDLFFFEVFFSFHFRL